MPKLEPNKNPYIRVGTDYFKIIEKSDRFGIIRKELKKWTKEEIKQDHLGSDKYYLDKIPKYDDFIIEPDNNGVAQVIGNCYNMYSPIPHKPQEGTWEWTETLLRHVFGDQYEAGLIYLQVLYRFPKQALPILAMVSEERQTGKSTFLDWLNLIFGANMTMIEPDVIGGQFNAEYATANIVGIDETILDKQIAVEKIKSLATKKFISVNIKNVSQFKLPFFGKIILASNNEDKFMRIDEKEIRFWVRKIPIPKTENHNILNDMIDEIPCFLHHLLQMPEPDFTLSRMVLTKDQIKNEYLEAVKKESKSGLYKELAELFNEYFDNHDQDTVYATVGDIKQRFFDRDNKIGRSYIRRVLRLEYEKEPVEKLQRYEAFDSLDKSVGKPYEFKRSEFADKYEQPYGDLPF